MEIDGLHRLARMASKHRDAAQWLENWVEVAQRAEWRSITDVRRDYPTADGVHTRRGVVTVFNVKGNTYRLLTAIRYGAQSVVVIDMLTHAEYDKDKWK